MNSLDSSGDITKSMFPVPSTIVEIADTILDMSPGGRHHMPKEVLIENIRSTTMAIDQPGTWASINSGRASGCMTPRQAAQSLRMAPTANYVSRQALRLLEPQD